MTARLSPAQTALLADLAARHADGRPLHVRPYSRREATAFALQRRGLADVRGFQWEITEAGLAATQEQTP